MKRIKRFSDGIGFAFWHHFDADTGTAIRWHRVRPGLFGIQIIGDIYGAQMLQFGCWWTIGFSLVAIHESRFLKS